MWRGCQRKAGKLWSAGAFFLPPQGMYYPVSFVVYVNVLRCCCCCTWALGCLVLLNIFFHPPELIFLRIPGTGGRGCCRSERVCFLTGEWKSTFFCFVRLLVTGRAQGVIIIIIINSLLYERIRVFQPSFNTHTVQLLCVYCFLFFFLVEMLLCIYSNFLSFLQPNCLLFNV